MSTYTHTYKYGLEGRATLALRGLQQALSITNSQSISITYLLISKNKKNKTDLLCPPLEPAFQVCSTRQAAQQGSRLPQR